MKFDEIVETVVQYEKVKNHLEQRPEDIKLVKEFLKEISGDYSLSWVSGFAKFLDNTFVKLYDGVNVENPHGINFQELLKTHHLILVPNHQSHADYVALQYTFYKFYKIPVFIAAGINLNIFPIGDLFKRCGAFFIRRKFDDVLYKYTFQGYIYYLLKTNKVVEFFFEGGRTRSGKLLPPRYGLFSMILDAHTKFDGNKPLMFIPVSLAHEHIPEERSHAKELWGHRKEKEKVSQLFKLYKLFNKKLGTVHITLGKGIVPELVKDLKQDTQRLAFECFNEVGKGMAITPSSLLALILLDGPSGALTWDQIEDAAKTILDYCEYMKIPVTKSLRQESFSQTLKTAMNLLIENRKLDVIQSDRLHQVFYSIKAESRVHLLYHKNMIIHHFIVPGIMNATWFNIFKGAIKDQKSLTKFLMSKRKELKYEFYLPSVKTMIEESLKIVEFSIGKKVESLSSALELTPEELYCVARKVRPFASAFSNIYESYYISGLAIKYMGAKKFKLEEYFNICEDIFKLEIGHGKVVRYPESFTTPALKDNLKYYQNLGIITLVGDEYQLVDMGNLSKLIQHFVGDINDQVSLNLELNIHT